MFFYKVYDQNFVQYIVHLNIDRDPIVLCGIEHFCLIGKVFVCFFVFWWGYKCVFAAVFDLGR